MKNKKTYIIALIFIWIGFIGAISFMEAWLKFQAPGITTPLGLGIGQLVFKALNGVEIVAALLITVIAIFNKENRIPMIKIWFYIPVFIVVIQTLWLLPALDTRASLVISGMEPPQNKLHLWYVLLEIIKTISLFTYGIKSIRTLRND